MNKNNLWYIDQRAEYLANMYLSRRDDLIIERQNHTHDRGIDILIDICHNDTLTGRVFGVRIRAERSGAHIRKAGHNLIRYRYPVSTLEIIRDIPFPVVLLLMIMEDDSGYYNWINRKKLDQTVNLSLKTQSVPFERLTEESMNRLINEINEWYEKRLFTTAKPEVQMPRDVVTIVHSQKDVPVGRAANTVKKLKLEIK